MNVYSSKKIDFAKMPEGVWVKQKIDNNKAKVFMMNTDTEASQPSDIKSGDKILVCDGEYTLYSYYNDIGSALQAKLDYLQEFCLSLNQRCY
jgi:hypothetical protein